MGSGHGSQVSQLTFALDGKVLLSVGMHQTALAWDVSGRSGAVGR
jgi:hypothetical protein